MRLFSRAKSTTDTPADRLMSALDKTQMMVWFDAQGQVTDANETFRIRVGRTRDDLVGRSHDALIAGADGTGGWAGGRSGPQDLLAITAIGAQIAIEGAYHALASDGTDTAATVLIAHEAPVRRDPSEAALAQLAAIEADHGKAVFDTTGRFLEVNDTFLDIVGYSREELLAGTHEMIVGHKYVKSADYKEFWAEVCAGKFFSGRFRRYGKVGDGMWLQCSYSPLYDDAGTQTGTVLLAYNVSDRKRSSDQMDAIGRVQACVEFTTDGHIMDANELFLDAVGYSLDEIKGQHHRMFLTEEEAGSPAYAEHWQRLARGEIISGEIARRRKDGSLVWLVATYNPVIGADGKPYKIVKYAQDVSERMRAVNTLQHAMSRLAQGDLSRPIDAVFSDEYEAVRRDFNTAQARLREAIENVIHGSDEIGAGTHEIANASKELSIRTESQAAALEQTAAAITEMAASVKSTAETADTTRTAAEKAKARADAGAEVMSKAREAMDAISDSSSEISSITSVIDDIAFQTNLLALNAGVEAARAGEAGRGFAVVASEVRALAQRSSEAATQIAKLIATSANQVEQGVDLVSRTGDSLAEIGTLVSDVAVMVSDIASAAAEQASGLNEITGSISSLDDVTQKNAAMFEETNAATQLLANEVEKLTAATASFKTLDDGREAGRPDQRLAS